MKLPECSMRATPLRESFTARAHAEILGRDGGIVGIDALRFEALSPSRKS
jgi:hypothetical protein